MAKFTPTIGGLGELREDVPAELPLIIVVKTGAHIRRLLALYPLVEIFFYSLWLCVNGWGLELRRLISFGKPFEIAERALLHFL